MPAETRSQHGGNGGASSSKNISRDLEIPRIYEIIDVDDSHPDPANSIDEQIAQATQERDRLLKKRQLDALQAEIGALKRHETEPNQAHDDNDDDDDTGTQSTSVVTGTKRAHDGTDAPVAYKKRSPIKLREYWGKTTREHREWIRDAEVAFRWTPWHFQTDEEKIIYAMPELRGEPRDLWFSYEAEVPASEQTWQDFTGFLLNLIGDPVNRQIDVAQAYAEASQRSHQSVRTFAAYLSTLENQLPAYNEEHRRSHLFTKLRPELRIAITNVQSVPNTREGLINLAARLETNLRKEGVLPTKNKKEKDDPQEHGHNKDKKKTAKTASGTQRQKRFDTDTRPKRNESSYNNRDITNVTCYTCNKKGHYSSSCTDEKAKEQKWNANRVPVASVSNTHRVSEDKGKDSPSSKAPKRRGYQAKSSQ